MWYASIWGLLLHSVTSSQPSYPHLFTVESEVDILHKYLTPFVWNSNESEELNPVEWDWVVSEMSRGSDRYDGVAQFLKRASPEQIDLVLKTVSKSIAQKYVDHLRGRLEGVDDQRESVIELQRRLREELQRVDLAYKQVRDQQDHRLEGLTWVKNFVFKFASPKFQIGPSEVRSIMMEKLQHLVSGQEDVRASFQQWLEGLNNVSRQEKADTLYQVYLELIAKINIRAEKSRLKLYVQRKRIEVESATLREQKLDRGQVTHNVQEEIELIERRYLGVAVKPK